MQEGWSRQRGKQGGSVPGVCVQTGLVMEQVGSSGGGGVSVDGSEQPKDRSHHVAQGQGRRGHQGSGVAQPGWELVLGGSPDPQARGWRGNAAKASLGALNLCPPGVAAFTKAQMLYIWAFGLRPLQLGLLLPVVLASLPFYCHQRFLSLCLFISI